jgi:hypothetical protein
MGSYEWGVDAPWRMEPPYDKLPITFSLHDVASQLDGAVAFGHLCGIMVAEMDENKYKETRTACVEPTEFPGASKLRTFSHVHGLTAVDTCLPRTRLLPRS